MSCKEIDMAAYKRRAHFDYFRSLAYPYAGVTVEVDISRLVPTLKMHSLPFFLPVLYCAVRAANSVPEFRQRIHGDSVVEYDYCEGSYTVALPDESYCYCVPKTDLPFDEFLDYTREAQRRAVEEPSIEEQGEADSLLFDKLHPVGVADSCRAAGAIAGRLEPAHHMGQILRALRERVPAGFRALPPCAGGRAAHRAFLCRA